MKLYAFAFLGGLSLMLAVPAYAERSPSIVVSEINWGGSGISTSDEWFELANISQTAIDVSGWTVTGVLSASANLTLPPATIIEPGSTLLVSNYDLGNIKSTLTIAPSIVTTAISLPNDNLAITLIDTQGNTVDKIDMTGPQIIGSSNPHVSMERDLLTFEWRVATTSINLGEINQFGTPGAISLPQVTEAPPIIPMPGEVADSEVGAEGIAPTKSDVSNEINFYVPEGMLPIEGATPDSDPSPPSTPDVDPTDDLEAATPLTEIDVLPANSPDSDEADPAAEPEAATPLEEPVSFEAGDVIINAFMSAPSDGTEWIELENPGDEDIDLTDWTIHDESGKETLLAGDIVAGEFAIIENPKGKLNNDGDAIVLVDPAGNVIDELEYGTEDLPAPKKGEIGSRENEIELSNNETYEPLLSDAPDASDAATTAVSESTDDDLPVARADVKSSPNPRPTELPAGRASMTGGATPRSKASPARSLTGDAKTRKSSAVVIEGVVTALPGTFAKQYFYIGGTQVYLNSGEFPELELGDRVQITGTQSETSGEPRIKLKFGTDIEVLESTEEEPRSIDNQDVTEAKIGELVTIQGHVVSRTDSSLTLEDDSGEASVVVAKKTNISLSDIGPVEATVTGVVRLKSGDKKIFPRSQSDIEITNDEQTASGSVTAPSTISGSAIPIAAGAGAGATSLGGALAWILKTRRLNLSSLLPTS